MSKKKYYAVRSGNKPGIYETWADCELQVKGFSGAQYKSFASLEKAEKYMIGENQDNKTIESADKINENVEKRIFELKEGES